MVDATRKSLVSQKSGLALKKNHYTNDVDKYDGQIACILLQKQEDNVHRQIGHWSKILNGLEPSLIAALQNFLAFVWAILVLHPCLNGTKCTDQGNHRYLRGILSSSDVTDRLA